MRRTGVVTSDIVLNKGVPFFFLHGQGRTNRVRIRHSITRVGMLKYKLNVLPKFGQIIGTRISKLPIASGKPLGFDPP